MGKHLLRVLPIIIIILLLSSCSGATEISVALGEKFSLAIGQGATISGENLKIRFVEVIGDSRCALGVECVWAGEASSLMEITYSGSKYQKVLTQPGLTEPPQTDFQNYDIIFDLLPYPREGQNIENEDYRLQLEINKKTS
jgi:hypothetical protein